MFAITPSVKDYIQRGVTTRRGWGPTPTICGTKQQTRAAAPSPGLGPVNYDESLMCTNIVHRQTYRQRFHRQISERGENFLLLYRPFQVSLVLSETQRSGSLAKLAMVMAKVDVRETPPWSLDYYKNETQGEGEDLTVSR